MFKSAGHIFIYNQGALQYFYIMFTMTFAFYFILK